jgi:arginyl-tRNA synthetase
VYKESDGAVIFEGEPYGLHTRVFVNAQGLPTYEAKDVGLSIKKWEDYHFDESIIITGNDITEYMKVVLKSIEQFLPELSTRTHHITHGNVKLAGGVKMSSRKGNFLRAIDVLDIAAEENEKAQGNRDEAPVLGAIKYAFLKNRIGPDLIFDPHESVSLQGNSGPYLQYAHARAVSIIRKLPTERPAGDLSFDQGERKLVVKMTEYPEVVEAATREFSPHLLCTYLYELAQEFNRFYEGHHIVGDEREAVRGRLASGYAGILKRGLTLLGIPAPEHM